MRTHAPSRALAPVAFLLYLAFVVYGSLVPLELRPMDWDQAIEGFRNIRYLDLDVVGRADWIANIVLYVPLAFLGCAALLGMGRGGWRAVLGVPLVGAFCLAVALAVEFSQQWFAPRTVSVNDLIAESIGTLIGLGLWGLGRRRIAALLAAIAEGGRPSVLAALVAYGILYLTLSLFPFDFVLSAQELQWRLESGNLGWLVAGACGEPIRCGARLALDALAILPLGALAALLWPALGVRRLFAFGVLIGLVLEPVQILIASGTSQGLSVPLRGAGMAAGGLLGARLAMQGPRPVARLLVLAAPILILPYLAGLVLVAGWFARPPLPLAEALGRLPEVHWMPFYYHYFTTEAAAMASSLAQLALYAPLGVLVWGLGAVAGTARARRTWGPWTAAALTLGLGAVVESGKLWFPPKHPDPTNLLAAMAGAVLACLLARWLERVLTGGAPRAGTRRTDWDGAPARDRPDLGPALPGGRGSSAPAARSPAAAMPAAGTPGAPAAASGTAPDLGGDGEVPAARPLADDRPRWPAPTARGVALGLLAGLPLVFGTLGFPLAWPILAALLALYGLLLWVYPLAWLAILPALLPILDLSPLTGRLALDAFDLAVLTTLAVGYARVFGVHRRPWPNPLFALALALLWLAWLLAMARGLWPLLGTEWPPAPSSHSPAEAWTVGKGMLWGLLLVPLLRRVPRGQRARAQSLLLAGTAFGLGLLVLAVVWERHVFVGLFDFADPFRATGTFASLATGGAYIEGYLVFCIPLVVAWALMRRDWVAGSLAALLLAGALYALYVTYARGGYLGLAVALLILALGATRLRSVPPAGRAALAAAMIAAAGIGTWAVLAGGTAGERLRASLADLTQRQAHWERALGLLGGPGDYLIGAGFGQYPSVALLLGGFDPRPGSFVVAGTPGGRFLRLAGGENVYLDQPVAVVPKRRYVLSARLRGGPPDSGIRIALCEKALLYSFECRWVPLREAADGGGPDGTYRIEIDSGTLGAGGPWPHRPVKLSIHNPGTAPVDLDDLSLKESGRELLGNGGFEEGADRWLLTSDRKEAWHIDQLWVETLFAQGALGVLALLTLLGALAARLWPGAVGGDPWAIGFAAAFAGLLTVGMTGSLLDAAPTATLLYLGAFAAAWLAQPADPRDATGAPRRRSRRRRPGGDGRQNAAAPVVASAPLP